MKHDRISELLEAADQMPLDCLAVALVASVGASLLIDAGRVSQQVIDDAQDRMPDGDGRALLAPPGRQAPVLRLQGGSFSPAGCLGRFGQGSAQPRAPLAGLSAQLPASTLTVARAHPRP